MAGLVALHPFKALSFVLLTLSAITLSLLWGEENSPGEGSQAESAPVVEATVPLWMVTPQTESLLIVNNSLPTELPLELVFYHSSGGELQRRSLLLEPRQSQTLSVTDLLSVEGSGALSIRYPGHDYDLGAQLELVDREDQSTVDVDCFFPSDFSTSTLTRILWSPAAKGERRLLLTNTTDDSRPFHFLFRQQGRILQEGEEILQARESRFFSLPRPGASSESDRLVEVKIDWQGEPSEVVGGVFWSGPGGALGFQALEDPSRRRSSRLSLTHLQGITEESYRADATAADKEFPLALQNRSERLLSAQLRLSGQAEEGTVETVERTLELAPRQGRVLVAARFLPSGIAFRWVTLDLQWQGDGRELLAQSWSILYQGRRAVRNPLVNPDGEDLPRGSNYPWLLDPQLDTHIYIKNPTEEAQPFIGHLFSEDGQEYDFGIRSVEAGKVEVIDLGQIQEGPVADLDGRLLSSSARSGQFLWFGRRRSTSRLLGRPVVESADGATAVSLSCPTDCEANPDRLIASLIVSPTSIFDAAGQSVQLTIHERFVDCASGSFLFNTNVTNFVHYLSSVPSVAGVDSTKLVNRMSGGACEIRASIEEEHLQCGAGFEVFGSTLATL